MKRSSGIIAAVRLHTTYIHYVTESQIYIIEKLISIVSSGQEATAMVKNNQGQTYIQSFPATTINRDR